jgi:Transposase IS66 family
MSIGIRRWRRAGHSRRVDVADVSGARETQGQTVTRPGRANQPSGRSASKRAQAKWSRSACLQESRIRRKFVDVHRAQGSAVAENAVRRIAELYAIEKVIRGSPPDKRAEVRQAKARPIFDDLEGWLAEQLTAISGKTPLAAAIRYADQDEPSPALSRARHPRWPGQEVELRVYLKQIAFNAIPRVDVFLHDGSTKCPPRARSAR